MGLSFQYEPSKRLPVQSQQLEQSFNMLTVNNKDARTTSLTSLILNIVNIDTLSYLIFVLKLLTLNKTKTLKIKSFLPFNFAITKICVAIHLAEDGTRMDSI